MISQQSDLLKWVTSLSIETPERTQDIISSELAERFHHVSSNVMMNFARDKGVNKLPKQKEMLYFCPQKSHSLLATDHPGYAHHISDPVYGNPFSSANSRTL